ncbi:MAG TPA: FadR/GntR family transcriptional regulator [Gaiellaceae bacterium]|nr:FadR/GntR family transcriptional regulator [Gaiellaceae bacterium]
MSDKPTAFAPIDRRKTYELVAERLIQQIGEGHLKPGDVLPTERELVQSYRVGRSSVREALRILESKGLIRANGNGAFSVAELRNPLNHSFDLLVTLDAASYAELFEVRRFVEGESAALAARRRTKAQLQRMESAIEAMEVGLGSEEEFIAADLRFHLTVAEATRNRVLLYLMHAIRELLQRSLSSSYNIPGSPEGAIEMHRLIAEAIAAKHPDQARERMQEHVARVERDTVRGEALR